MTDADRARPLFRPLVRNLAEGAIRGRGRARACPAASKPAIQPLPTTVVVGGGGPDVGIALRVLAVDPSVQDGPGALRLPHGRQGEAVFQLFKPPFRNRLWPAESGCCAARSS
jgi:hypothetical protein